MSRNDHRCRRALPVPDASGRDVRRHGFEIRLPAVDGDRSFGHRRRDHRAGLHARERPEHPHRRNGQRRLGPRLAALRQRSWFRVPTGFPGATLYSDPVTGYYSISLVAGFLRLRGDLSRPGYVPGGGPLAVDAPAIGPRRDRGQLDPRGVADLHRARIRRRRLRRSARALGRASTRAPSRGLDGANALRRSVGRSTRRRPCFQFEATAPAAPVRTRSSTAAAKRSDRRHLPLTPAIDLSGRTSAAIQWANDYIIDDSRRPSRRWT